MLLSGPSIYFVLLAGTGWNVGLLPQCLWIVGYFPFDPGPDHYSVVLSFRERLLGEEAAPNMGLPYLEATGVGKAVFLRVWEVVTEVKLEKYGNICAGSLRRDECQSEAILDFFELKQQNGKLVVIDQRNSLLLRRDELRAIHKRELREEAGRCMISL